MAALRGYGLNCVPCSGDSDLVACLMHLPRLGMQFVRAGDLKRPKQMPRCENPPVSLDGISLKKRRSAGGRDVHNGLVNEKRGW